MLNKTKSYSSNKFMQLYSLNFQKLKCTLPVGVVDIGWVVVIALVDVVEFSVVVGIVVLSIVDVGFVIDVAWVVVDILEVVVSVVVDGSSVVVGTVVVIGISVVVISVVVK